MNEDRVGRTVPPAGTETRFPRILRDKIALRLRLHDRPGDVATRGDADVTDRSRLDALREKFVQLGCGRIRRGALVQHEKVDVVRPKLPQARLEARPCVLDA